MNFKRLEIFGFKSFADKLIVKFEDGVTGIVGPNGCGKSNVADAIKWVLGERRAKSMRGKTMQDVIFNGTQKRTKMSYCEVSLVFDNSNNIFKSDEDELIITRKLFATNESEYLINKRPCRLKEILELISDTGLGKEGYSIIGQGKVDEIINSKPEDRRGIFEEAAGISLFKEKKNGAESKLDKTQENLDRINDIVYELERQILPLKNDADNARQYESYRSILMDLEANSYVYQYENNDTTKNDLKKFICGLTEEIQYKEGRVIDLDESYNKNMVEINNVDRIISNHLTEKTELLIEAEKNRGEGKVLYERLENLNKENISTLEIIKEKSDDIVFAEQELNNNIKNKNDILKQIESISAEYETYNTKYENVTREIIKKEQELETRNKVIIEAMTQLADIKADLSGLKTEYNNLQEKEVENKILIENKKAKYEEEKRTRDLLLDSLNDSQQTRNKIYSERNLLKKNLNDFRTQIAVLNSEIRTLENTIETYGQKAKLLKDIHDNYEGYSVPVKKLMQNAKYNPIIENKIIGVVAELMNVPSEYEIAIEMALGNAIQNVVTTNEIDAKYIIEYLKAEKLGRITFLPLTSIKPRNFPGEYSSIIRERGCLGFASELVKYNKKYNDVFSSLLGATVICDEYDNALAIARKYNYSFRIVTLQGELFNPSGAITGGSRRSDGSTILSQEREISFALDMRKKAENALVIKNQSLETITKDSDISAGRLKLLDDKFQEAEIEYAKLAEKEATLTEKVDELLEELEKVELYFNKVVEKRTILEEKLILAGYKEGDITSKRITEGDNAEKSKEMFDSIKKERDLLLDKVSKVKATKITLEGKLDLINHNIERLTNEKEKLALEIYNKKSLLKILETNIKEIQAEMSEITVSDEDQEKLNILQAKLTECETYKQKTYANLNEINKEKDMLTKELSFANEKRLIAESKIEKIDTSMNLLKERLLEEYSLDHVGAYRFKNPNFDNTNATTEITKYRRLINKLGPVNLNAIAQYAEVSERFIELSRQKTDLEKAKADLLDIISDISKEMTKQFTTEFNKINSNFQMIFKELFGGGTAKLVVMHGEGIDPLEAGIEILAQPPGKSLSNLTLFSGGEKALTAIAILFSILRLKPMPFCVLDEIEAALDDANAGLFARYLKRFSNETQFIVITHRKPTMELADRLFGVTMEEQGVSKMVSVRFEDAIKHIEETINGIV